MDQAAGEVGVVTNQTDKVTVGIVGTVAIILTIVATALGMYHLTFASKVRQLAVIDIQTISAELEEEARSVLVNKTDATDEERKAAAEAYEGKMRNLQSIVNELGDKCKCTIIIKAAILNNKNNQQNDIVDYSNEVREKIGLKPVSSK